MKNLFLILFLLMFAYKAMGQQTISKLNVKELKLPSETSARALYLNGSGQIKSSSTVSDTELGYLDGLSQNIQTSMDNKVNITGDESISGTKTFTGKQVSSSTSNGFHPCPSMTDTQMLAIPSPVNGDCVHNTTLNNWMQYDSTDLIWEEMGAGGIEQWSTATDYEIDDLVVESDKIYIALTAHTSGTFATDLANADWRVLYTSIGGSSEVDSGLTVEEISVPNGQLTHKGSNVYRIETGNDDILLNGSFEHSTFSTSWDIDDGTEDGVLENTTVADGGQAIKFSPSAETVILHQDSTLYATSLSGQNAVVSCQVYSDSSDVYLCARGAGALVATSDGTNITDCTRHSGSGTYEDLRLPFIFNGTSNGVAVVSLTATDATAKSITGNVKADKCKIKMGSLDSSAVVGPWTSWTPTGSWSANTTYTGKYRQVGQNLEMEVLVSTSGAPTSATLTINLPSGYTIDTAKMVSSTAEQFLGHGVVNDSGSTFYKVSVDYSSTTAVRILQLEAASTYLRTVALTQAVPMTWGASDTLRVFFTVPLVELNGNVNTYTAPCGAKCVDVFSAKISSSGVVSGENVDWIDGNCSLSTADFTCTHKTGIFTVMPSCTATIYAATNITAQKLASSSSTNTGIRTYDADASTPSAQAFELICQKSGADFTATRLIQGSFNEVMTMPGVTKPKTCRYAFGGAAATLTNLVECSTGTCVEVEDKCGTGTPPAFSATGVYTGLSLGNGTFAPNTSVLCECNAFDATDGQARRCYTRRETGQLGWASDANGAYATTVVNTDTAGVQNGFIILDCKGQAP